MSTLLEVCYGTFDMLVDNPGFNGAFKEAAPAAFDGFSFQIDVQGLVVFLQTIFWVALRQNFVQ